MKVFEVIRESKANGYILTGMLFDNKEDAQKCCDKMNAAVKLDKESDVNYKWYELVSPTPINWITYEVTFFYGLRDPDPVIKIFDGDDQFHTGDVIAHTVSRNIVVRFSVIVDTTLTREKVIDMARNIAINN